MGHLTLAEGELRFAELIWEREPIPSGELVRLCEESFGWKKSTTYTVLKKLCDRGIFQNKGSIVTPLVSRQAFYARQSQRFVEETFDGSLPAFIAAFSSGGEISREDLAEIRRMLDQFDKED